MTIQSFEESSFCNQHCTPIKQKYGNFSRFLIVIALILVIASIYFFSQCKCQATEKLLTSTVSSLNNSLTSTSQVISNSSTLVPTTTTSAQQKCCLSFFQLIFSSFIFSGSLLLFCILMLISTKSNKIFKKQRGFRRIKGEKGNQPGLLSMANNYMKHNKGISLCQTIKTLKIQINIVILCVMIITVLLNIGTETWIANSLLGSSCSINQNIIKALLSSSLFIIILIIILGMYIFGSKHTSATKGDPDEFESQLRRLNK